MSDTDTKLPIIIQPKNLLIKLSRIKIIADDKIPFLKGVLEPYADVIYLPGNQISRESVMNTDALLIRTRTRCDATLLEGTAVKFIATATIGSDHIDADYCMLNGITWVNAPGCNSYSVQQYITAVLLTLAQNRNFSLSEKTLGIIGVGNVGSKIQKAANLLGMKVKLNDPPRAQEEGAAGFVSLDEILETCDIITIHVPLIREGEDKTFHLFDSTLFGKVREGTWLLNSSRGEVIETRSLKTALTSGRLKGAVLDVWENEPDIDLELLRQVTVSTPHIAGYSVDGKANGTAMTVQALSRFFGLPLLGFYPPLLPVPSEPVIEIDGTGKSGQQIIHEAVIHTYAIMEDHNRLQLSPGTFEQQRGNYPVRREFGAFTLNLSNVQRGLSDILEKLGFRVNNINIVTH
jgi:erythronate-4-phosphate dehydrogenase